MSTSTTPTRPVVVGVDGGPGSAGALRFAAAESVRRGTTLHLVHVVPSYLSTGSAIPLADLHEIGKDLLSTASDTVEEFEGRVHVEATLAHGDPARGIARAVENPQLIVVGRESRHGVDRLLTGAVTAAVVTHAPCDVAVVPSSWVHDEQPGRVVVGIKDDRSAERLVTRAFDEAAARSDVLTAVTAWRVSELYLQGIQQHASEDHWYDRGRELVVHAVEGAQKEHPEVEVDLRVEQGKPAKVLLDASDGADLLVVGRHRGTLTRGFRLGGVVHAVLRLSEVPVLVVSDVHDEDEPAQVLEAAGSAAR